MNNQSTNDNNNVINLSSPIATDDEDFEAMLKQQAELTARILSAKVGKLEQYKAALKYHKEQVEVFIGRIELLEPVKKSKSAKSKYPMGKPTPENLQLVLDHLITADGPVLSSELSKEFGFRTQQIVEELTKQKKIKSGGENTTQRTYSAVSQ